MAWDPSSDIALRGFHAPRVGAGDSRAAAATRRVESASATATADGDGPDLLGRAVETVEELAEFFAGGAARDRGAVASPGFQAVLGMEESTPMGRARRLPEACGQDESPRHLIRDRDQVYGERFSRQARLLDIREAVIAPRSPWQNAYAERVIGSLRRECLDHVVVVGERHLLGILSKYVDYYNRTRTHLSLAKDAPESRSVQPPSQGRVVAVPRVGGLHHEYLRQAA